MKKVYATMAFTFATLISKSLWVGRNTSKQVGHTRQWRCSQTRCRRDCFEENDPEGVALE